jgi:hypothetical protein
LGLALLMIGHLQGSVGGLAFEKSDQLIQGACGAWGSAAADLDGDGDLDVVLGTLQPGPLALINGGNGRFSASPQTLGAEMHDIGIGDLNGDGAPDLFFAPIRRQQRPVYLNAGRLGFENHALVVDNSEAVQLVDFDRDGDLDAYLGKNSVLFLNDGRGRFTMTRLPISDYSTLVDLNGDGYADGLAPAFGEGFVVRWNDRKGNFGEPLLTPCRSVTLCDYHGADLDGDGDLDVAYTEALDEKSRKLPSGVLWNDGTGRLSLGEQRLSPPTAYGSVASGDLNGDGRLDLVITDFERPAQVWLNAGKGRFVDSGIRLGESAGLTNVLVGDLDGDGDLDVFLPNRRTGRHEIWFNRLKEKRVREGGSLGPRWAP